MKKQKLIDLVKSKFNLPEKLASSLILAGLVLVNEKIITKSGLLIDSSAQIRIKQKGKYVSRGAYKLLGAIKAFDISIKDKVCIDVGSSTGGFTQVLLENQAKKVYAIDCGINQLSFILRNDSRVISLENTKITSITKDDFKEAIDLAVIDVSFTSSISIIEHVNKYINVNNIIVLIKPQFEYNRLYRVIGLTRDFNGVINNDEERTKIINYIKDELVTIGFKINSVITSPIKGAKGNIEYLLYVCK